MSLKEQALNLYRLAFPDDSEEYARNFIEHFFDTNCRFATENGKLISMLFLLDCEIVLGEKSMKACYLYAAATHPDYRGKGYMTRLINTIKDEATSKQLPIITKPADEGLFSFYRSLGFRDSFYFEEQLQHRTNKSDVSLKKITPIEYKNIREKLLKKVPHISLGDNMNFALSSMYLLGGENICCCIDLDGEVPTVKELISNKDNAEDAVLCAIGVQKAYFRTAKLSKPFAMLFTPDGITLPEKMYMGLAMD